VQADKDPPLRTKGTVEKTMLTDDYLMGMKKDLDELKEVKVKLPARQLVNLHILKITANRTMQDVVSEALNDFFAKVSQAKPAEA
jgi:hypothetical protein